MTKLVSPFLLLAITISSLEKSGAQRAREGFFNTTSYVSLYPPIVLHKHIGLSFRTCTGGQLFSQRSPSPHSIILDVRAEGLFFTVTILNKRYETRISANLIDNEWHTVNILYRMGNLTISTTGHQQIIANSTYNSEILTQSELWNDNAVLVVGNGFSGCILEGPSIVFNPTNGQIQAHNVEWGPCPIPPKACGVVNHCAHEPCIMHGRCILLPDRYLCQCPPRYSGNNCQIDNGPPCSRNPCKNNGKCVEDKTGDYTCYCLAGFAGKECDTEIITQVCDNNNPCRNNGTCIPNGGSNLYKCVCQPGFEGKDCEMNINECLSGPCQHGGTCIDGVNNYTCLCGRTGYTGPNCDININECENNPCLNNGICFDNYGGYTCQCTTGFGGQNCELKLSECASSPCNFPNTVCVETNRSYQCVCKPGYTGIPPNCTRNDACTNANYLCQNGATCRTSIDGYICICPAGYTGTRCEINIDDCVSLPCQNGGTCLDGVNGYFCNCTSDFMGVNCELRYEACVQNPCQHNGTCVSDADKKKSYCECPVGFEGEYCENNINDCINKRCPDNNICMDGINSFECRCPNGLTGPDCTIDVSQCSNNPCLNGGTCIESPGNYTCHCLEGYTGFHCEQEINVCEVMPKICNNGICVSKGGSYQCFCTPGFSGDHCEIDFDECLSHPCFNGATCENKINGFNCICTRGYTGKDCSVNINECDSNPCVGGSTCKDEIATFSCICPPGLTGRLCETNIDDCESSPCQNGGVCIDGLNSYSCNCTDTGYEGQHCELNIDECTSNPCKNGAQCRDMVKDYLCECFPGYTGINCETDINECDSNPCQQGGTCKERSKLYYYVQDYGSHYGQVNGTTIFNQNFVYSAAAGYECVCQTGVTGANCEININECESSPCRWGLCVDHLNNYTCECEDGYEGVHCEIDIDECAKYTPCIHGTCLDQRAGYFCACDGKYGGKNCSVELTGCLTNQCLNNGSCKPYLENETIHKFNCSCPNGFQGPVCEKITTMSLNGSSYMMVNTTREEGYDIQLRFKTTLSNGLLAIGKGSTFYILELNQGRLNLHSSLLNKWEGVFIGSALNDSNWQKVFVAINASHLVLAANEEQTIYPINLNEGANASHTSFPLTYLGGAIAYLRRLTHGPPSFVGCVQDVIINGQWVLPQESGTQPVSFVGIEVGCKREPQCDPNPCHSGGHCTDLWRNFSCACERPFLGHTCQYNLTAATFGHENITESMVKVVVDPAARKAVRSIMDISMFIRTREKEGGIFYLGSNPGTVPFSEETVIAARLQGGELQVTLQLNGVHESSNVAGVPLDNGYSHLIQVIRNVTLVGVRINGTEHFRKTIGANGQLDLQVLQLGAIPGASTERNFKGVIQDVQMSNGSRTMVVEFYPLSAEDVNIPPPLGKVVFDKTLVLEGVVSDDSCRDEPCMHGGICTITWNDFSCACSVGYKGKKCQEMEFCQVQDCPTGSECRNLNHGYECVANITLHESIFNATGLRYKLIRGEQRVPLNDISVSYRSRTGGYLLQIGPNSESKFLFIHVYSDQIAISWNSSAGEEIKRISKETKDGDWTTVRLAMVDGILTADIISATEVSSQHFSANFSQAVWDSLISTTSITIGGGDNAISIIHLINSTKIDGDHKKMGSKQSELNGDEYSTYGGANDGIIFRGCIGEVRIGGLLLPFFTPQEINSTNTSSKDHFELMQGSTLGETLGCQLCFDEECKNEGMCKNSTEEYICECKAGFAGDDCSENINECLENDCKNNSTCVDGLANYTCQCLAGWQGSLCDIEIDECASNPCQNNGTCIDLLAKFECKCEPEFVGLQCEQLKQITCESAPCYNNAECQDIINPKTYDNFTCICLEGFQGVYCESAFCEITPCLNRGVCISRSKRPMCDCTAGYTGHICETDVDECASNPCEHGAVCHDDIASFTCDCTGTGYTGHICNMDIDECLRGSPCGISGHCVNTIGSFHCICQPSFCGIGCAFPDPCIENPCEHGGTCLSACTDKVDYNCECINAYTGKNCTIEPQFTGTRVADIALIVVPVIAILLIAGLISLSVFVMMARKKRATRGTYSPSSQEYCNPRVELDNVIKPPPEERLI